MSGGIDLWNWRLQGGDRALLSPDEVARADRFVFARDRDRFVAARARLRRILGGYTGTDPAALRFRYGPHGRPEIDGPAFSLSHSGDRALLAVGVGEADRLPLGVDLEAIRAMPPEVARSHFAPGEWRALTALPPPLRAAAFFRCWTRKEAYLKAQGTGLATDLASFEVTLHPDEPPRLLRCASGEAAHWHLMDLDAGPGWAAALALRGEGPAPRLIWRARD